MRRGGSELGRRFSELCRAEAGRALSSAKGVEQPRKSFLNRLADSVKDELAKSKEMKEQLEKLKREKDGMENTEAMQKAREKYKKVELESYKQTELVKEKLSELVSNMQKAVSEASKTELGKKTLEASREIAESVGKAAAKAGDTAVAKNVAVGMRAVQKEIDTVTKAQMYERPEELQTRAHFSTSGAGSARVYAADETTTTVELHKDARWYTGFKTWYDSSPTVDKMMDWKLKYEESDSRSARLARFFTDGIHSAIFSTTSTDVSTVLTEIVKVDPSFDKDEFSRFAERVIIPNVMEAQIRGDLEVLADWCHEVPFRQLSVPIQQNKEIGYNFSDSKVLDTSRVELVSGKMLDQGPVFIISFSAHVINVIKNKSGKVIEGDPDTVIKMNHVWALCRDMAVLDPNAAWKVLEIHFAPAPMSV